MSFYFVFPIDPLECVLVVIGNCSNFPSVRIVVGILNNIRERSINVFNWVHGALHSLRVFQSNCVFAMNEFSVGATWKRVILQTAHHPKTWMLFIRLINHKSQSVNSATVPIDSKHHPALVQCLCILIRCSLTTIREVYDSCWVLLWL